MKSVKSEIKYVNMPAHRQPQEALSRTQPRGARTPAVTVGKPETPARAKSSKATQPDPDRVLEAYEQGRRAFQELSAMHSDAQAEAEGAMRRLDRLEQDLRREREQSTRYAAQIASQEQELRKAKEGKRAAEELNSRLNACMAAKPDGGLETELARARTERDQARAKKDQLKTERDQLKTERGQIKTERDQLKTERDQLRTERGQIKTERDQLKTEKTQLMQRVRSYSDMVNHAERAMGICARVCATHAPETSRDIQETQKTLREFQQSMAG